MRILPSLVFQPVRVSTACLVLGASMVGASTTTSLPLVRASVRAERRAAFFIFLLTRMEWSFGWGPWTTPPPVHWGARFEPWRARPVPFWRHGFLPPPRTWARVFVAWVPARWPAIAATTT